MKTYTKLQLIEMLVNESFAGSKESTKKRVINKANKVLTNLDILNDVNKNRYEFAMVEFGKFIKLNNSTKNKSHSKSKEFKGYTKIGD